LLVLAASISRFASNPNGPVAGTGARTANSLGLNTLSYWTRIHEALRTTPAMAAGLTDRLWDIEEIIGIDGPHGAEAGET
jgi:hypothetical protein